MAYLKFNKGELVNLEYSLNREVLATNRAGGYLSTTIICCNTRKYHGLLILPVEEFGGENHVLLSVLDETVIQHNKSFNLGIHKYPGTYEPQGHKYIYDFEYEPVYTLYYGVGGVKLKKEMVLVHNESQLLIRYTLLEANSATTLRLKPFLAYRNIHKLSRANMMANTKYQAVPWGIRSKLYNGFPPLNMQVSKANDFIAVPDWYYNVEYSEEQARGYDFREDLFVPGYFEFPIEKGESIIFSASVEPADVEHLKEKFQTLVDQRSPRNNCNNCLNYSATQFVVKNEDRTEVVAGYPWFGRWGRDTFVALPGVTLYANNNVEDFEAVMDTMCRELHGGLFPNIGKKKSIAYNSVDASMWFFKALQEYGTFMEDDGLVWRNYGEKMKLVLNSFRKGINANIGMRENGLIWADEPGKALTWMDAIVEGVPVTARAGYQVEVNALWYNAVCYTLKLAKEAEDNVFVAEWEAMPNKIRRSFIDLFWNDGVNYLADYVNGSGQNLDIRPNQIFACSLDYSMLTDEMKRDVIRVIKKNLLTPKGLRTLAPSDANYHGTYGGTQPERDRAYHQGTVWPWLLGGYIEACLKLYGKSFTEKATELLSGFEEDMTSYGVCSVAEIYDGNPPYKPNGSISQAWSVGEILRSKALVKKYELKENDEC